LERHARERGCTLLIDPSVVLDAGIEATIVSLETLLEFLESMPNELVEVILSPEARDGNITAVGDWFVAESMVRRIGEGYRQTVFTRHAPTALRLVRKFDAQIDDLRRE
jgi:hypothetical protein